jgi:hypothetical protein
MQPTYLPWSGYFNLLAEADKFVFLDEVQFERQSWQSRNRILLDGKEHLLVVPVKRDGLGTLINQATISNENNWRRTHWRTLQAAYGKAPYGEQLLAVLKPFYEDEDVQLLSDLNQSIIRALASALNIYTPTFRASDLGCGGQRSARLAKICETLGCDEYLSPRGSEAYLREDNFEEEARAKLSFQEFKPAPYKQYRADRFVSHLSVVDGIANLGFDGARAYITKEGRC